jgi:polysaccharide biosynthesis transport protein
MAEEIKNTDRLQKPDEALLIRLSQPPATSSLDQVNYNSNYFSSTKTREFNLRKVWRKITKRKWLVLIIISLVTTIVAIESFRTRALYQGTVKIAVTQDNADLKLGNVDVATNANEQIKSEILLLKTYPLLEDVVVQLKLNQDPGFLDVTHKRSIVDAIRALFQRVKDPVVSNPTYPTTGTNEIVAAGFGKTRTPEESAQLAPYVDTLQKNLLVEHIPETNVINISFIHTDPLIAMKTANGVARDFIGYSYQIKTENIIKSTSELDITTRNLKAKQQQAEEELANYSGKNKNVFSINEKDNLVSERLTDIYSKALKAENERIIKQSVYEEVRQGRVLQLPEAYADLKSQQFQNRLNDLQLKEAELSSVFGPENQNLSKIQEQIKELKTLIAANTKSLEERLKADYERAQREERLIKKSLEKAKSEATQQNEAAIQFNILKANAETARNLYNDFLAKTNQSQANLMERSNTLRVIEPSRMGSLIGPRRMRAILLGFILSLLGGVGLALLLEHFDNSVKNVDDVQRATQLATLALIPSMTVQSARALRARKKAEKKNKKESLNTDELLSIIKHEPEAQQPSNYQLATIDGLAPVAEAYRMLRTSILLSSAGPLKTILVTSSQAAEGKTTTAVNTAISLAQLGSSVLLIDADMRRPSVHRIFKVAETHGLSNYLSGNDQIDEMIVKLSIPNLSVLTAGTIPQNPAELIGSERMRDLLRLLAEKYDHVLIDSPPLINVTDPVILSTMVDTTILIVQAGRSSGELLRRARQELDGVGAKVFGVVLNNVDVKREGHDDYYYNRYHSNYTSKQKGGSAG